MGVEGVQANVYPAAVAPSLPDDVSCVVSAYGVQGPRKVSMTICICSGAYCEKQQNLHAQEWGDGKIQGR